MTIFSILKDKKKLLALPENKNRWVLGGPFRRQNLQKQLQLGTNSEGTSTLIEPCPLIEAIDVRHGSNFGTKLWTSAPNVNFGTNFDRNINFGTMKKWCAEVNDLCRCSYLVPKFLCRSSPVPKFVYPVLTPKWKYCSFLSVATTRLTLFKNNSDALGVSLTHSPW